MIVVDASALVELISDERNLSLPVKEELYGDAEWIVPEHAMIETTNALRGLWIGRRSTDAEFDAHLLALSLVTVSHFPLPPLLPRIRRLAANTTAYDAAYIALAEQLDVPLITTDAKLARIPGSRAEVRVITAD